MKFKLDNLPQGIIACRILEPLKNSEALQIVKGIEKVLSNGKARIILEFNKTSAEGEGGADFLEKSLRPFKVLAKKMRGDILFVVPDPYGDKIFGAYPDMKAAEIGILGEPEGGKKGSSDLVADLEVARKEAKELKTQNQFLEKKIEELIHLIRKPSTDDELKKGIEHYRVLAAQVEAESPSDKVPAKGATKK